jgi:sporulation protein YlmC with PRC-barrel domain
MTDYATTTADTLDRTDNPLISAERVAGTAVYDTAGEKLGSIDTVMIDKHSGEVRFAVMSFGGFLGMGERYHQLPWDGLTYDEGMGGYVVNLSREALEGAPNYGRDEIDTYDYRSGSATIDDYYGRQDGFYSPAAQQRRSRWSDDRYDDADIDGVTQPGMTGLRA